MRYLAILDELFSSDTWIIFAIAILAALVIGMKSGSRKRGSILSAVIYISCEILMNLARSYMAEFILLVAGTAALGCMSGFVLAAVIKGVRK